jgi:hypothetical protein
MAIRSRLSASGAHQGRFYDQFPPKERPMQDPELTDRGSPPPASSPPPSSNAPPATGTDTGNAGEASPGEGTTTAAQINIDPGHGLVGELANSTLGAEVDGSLSDEGPAALVGIEADGAGDPLHALASEAPAEGLVNVAAADTTIEVAGESGAQTGVLITIETAADGAASDEASEGSLLGQLVAASAAAAEIDIPGGSGAGDGGAAQDDGLLQPLLSDAGGQADALLL